MRAHYEVRQWHGKWVTAACIFCAWQVVCARVVSVTSSKGFLFVWPVCFAMLTRAQAVSPRCLLTVRLVMMGCLFWCSTDRVEALMAVLLTLNWTVTVCCGRLFCVVGQSSCICSCGVHWVLVWTHAQVLRLHNVFHCQSVFSWHFSSYTRFIRFPQKRSFGHNWGTCGPYALPVTQPTTSVQCRKSRVFILFESLFFY